MTDIMPQTGSKPFLHLGPLPAKIRIYAQNLVLRIESEIYVAQVQQQELHRFAQQPLVQGEGIPEQELTKTFSLRSRFASRDSALPDTDAMNPALDPAKRAVVAIGQPVQAVRDRSTDPV